jgi:hypothetical protein
MQQAAAIRSFRRVAPVDLVSLRERGCDTEEVGGHLAGTRLRYLAAATAVPVLYAVRVRPRMLTWGATRDETVRPYPGDELVADPDSEATMSTTLPAQPESVWRWLVQMGGGRGGWYSWDWLDNNGRPSANRIVPEWQSLKQGQHLDRVFAPGNKGPSYFTVEVLEPNRTLVLHSTYGMFSGLSFDPSSGPVPWAYVDGIWGFHLRATPSGGTRLVVRSRSRNAPRPVARPLNLLLGEPLHFLMQTLQFQNLHKRVKAETPPTSARALDSGLRDRKFQRGAA